MQLFVFGFDIWLPILVHIIIYYIIAFNGPKSGKFITILSIASLSVYHIYRMIVDYGNWTLDVSTILMPMVCKYSLFAYAYQDGNTAP